MPDSPARRRSATHREDYKWMLKRLRAARERAGFTQSEAASALGRPQSFVAKCELGERRIDPIDLLDFAKLYGRPVTHFLPKGRR